MIQGLHNAVDDDDNDPLLPGLLPLIECDVYDRDLQQYDTKHTVMFHGEPVFIDSRNWRSSSRLTLQLVTCCLIFVMSGLSDQTIGALIPRFQAYYHLNDLDTSMIFLSQVCGYFILAILNDPLHTRLGFGGVVCTGCICTTLCFLVISTHPPYCVLVTSYLLNGLGIGALDASINAWIGNLVDSNQLLGILHGMFGVGCILAPPMISRLVERAENPWRWSLYYLILAIHGMITLMMTITCFKHETSAKFKYMSRSEIEILACDDRKSSILETIELQDDNESSNNGDLDSLSSVEEPQIIQEAVSAYSVWRVGLVWLLAAILFLYVGGELAFGDWLITFLTRVKQLDHETASYMAMSFWGGLTVGRVFLGFATARFFGNEIIANLIYMTGSATAFLAFYGTTYLQSISLLYVTTMIAGMFVGPIFPTTIRASLGILPPSLHVSGVGLICAMGGGGAAGMPLLVGMIALTCHRGLRMLPLMVCIIFSALALLWLVLAHIVRSTAYSSTCA